MAVWKGHYSLSADNVEGLQEKKIDFELHLNLNEGSFTGTMLDTAYAELSDDTIVVTGFFEDNYVSFVAKYPLRAVPNAEGIFVLDTNLPNHEVTFYGEFEEDSKKISGDWEIVENTELGVFGVNVLYSSGKFEMLEPLIN